MGIAHIVAAGMVFCGIVAMSLHKLTEQPVLEISFWALSFVLFALLEILLYRPPH